MLPEREARGYGARCFLSRVRHLIFQVFLRLHFVSAHPMHANGRKCTLRLAAVAQERDQTDLSRKKYVKSIWHMFSPAVRRI
jgi:hypothetical protein